MKANAASQEHGQSVLSSPFVSLQKKKKGANLAPIYKSLLVDFYCYYYLIGIGERGLNIAQSAPAVVRFIFISIPRPEHMVKLTISLF